MKEENSEELYFISLLTGISLASVIKIDVMYPEVNVVFYDMIKFNHNLQYAILDYDEAPILTEVENLENRKDCFKEAYLILIDELCKRRKKK